jgi:hypothetical protein
MEGLYVMENCSQLEQLRELLASDQFHHATYRCIGTLWEGLYIYRTSDNYPGFTVVLAFLKTDPKLSEAEKLVCHTGVSVGAYGQG